MKIMHITRVSLLVSLSIVLSFVKVFSMPQGGSITLMFLPLFFINRRYRLLYSTIAVVIVATINVMFDGYFLNPIQVGFDYYFPIFIMTIASAKRFENIRFLIALVIALGFYSLSGYLFFEVPFKASVIYNGTWLIPTVILNVIIYKLTKHRILAMLREDL